jgi:hypothetical protein
VLGPNETRDSEERCRNPTGPGFKVPAFGKRVEAPRSWVEKRMGMDIAVFDGEIVDDDNLWNMR